MGIGLVATAGQNHADVLSAVLAMLLPMIPAKRDGHALAPRGR
jgi:hypothetical protein